MAEKERRSKSSRYIACVESNEDIDGSGPGELGGFDPGDGELLFISQNQRRE